MKHPSIHSTILYTAYHVQGCRATEHHTLGETQCTPQTVHYSAKIYKQPFIFYLFHLFISDHVQVQHKCYHLIYCTKVSLKQIFTCSSLGCHSQEAQDLTCNLLF